RGGELPVCSWDRIAAWKRGSKYRGSKNGDDPLPVPVRGVGAGSHGKERSGLMAAPKTTAGAAAKRNMQGPNGLKMVKGPKPEAANRTATPEYTSSQEALRDSEARYRRLFETAQDGILILDAKTGLITDVNPFLMKLL